MKPWVLAFLVAVLLVSPAGAFRNDNGALVVHTFNQVSYSGCNQYPGGDCCNAPIPGDCAALGTRLDTYETYVDVIWFIAAFHESSDPAVATIQFGVEHDLMDGYITRWSSCRATLDLPDQDWPYGPGGRSGNLVAFNEPVRERLFAFYWFAVELPAFEGHIGTWVYPSTGEAKFVDDGVPPNEDLIDRFGRIGIWQDGWNECPIQGPDLEGACCLLDGSCVYTDSMSCGVQGGVYQGDWIRCQPNPCQPPQLGACCAPDGGCYYPQFQEDCERIGGIFMGVGVDCSPDPCTPFGACCLPDGSCQYTMESVCLDQGFVFIGAGIPCEPNPCVPPFGACCFPDQSCQMLFDWTCEDEGGQFLGAGTDCAPNPCLPSPIRSTTWGEIRIVFR